MVFTAAALNALAILGSHEVWRKRNGDIGTALSFDMTGDGKYVAQIVDVGLNSDGFNVYALDGDGEWAVGDGFFVEEEEDQNDDENNPIDISMSQNGTHIAVLTQQIATGDAADNKVYYYRYDPTKTGTDEKWVLKSSAEVTNGASVVEISDDGSTIVVGTPSFDVGGGETENGKIEIFKVSEDGGTMTIAKTFEGAAESALGASIGVSADGTRIVVGAPNYDIPGETATADAGAIQIITYNKKTPGESDKSEYKVGPSAEAKYGQDVGITADGGRIVVGVYHGDKDASKVDENQGYIEVLDLTALADFKFSYSRVGERLYGTEKMEGFGWYATISRDGMKVAGTSVEADGPDDLEDGIQTGGNGFATGAVRNGKVQVWLYQSDGWNAFTDVPAYGATGATELGNGIEIDDSGRRFATATIVPEKVQMWDVFHERDPLSDGAREAAAGLGIAAFGIAAMAL